MITAKHVIYDDEIQVSTFSYEIHKKPPNTAVETFTFDINAAIKHPEDEIDLAAVQFPDSIVNSTELYPLCVTSKMVKQNNEFLLSRSAVIPVIMYGYPAGLWDQVNHFPIIRTGHTASHVGIDFNGVKEGRLSIPNYEGDSGAPIFKLPQAFEYSKRPVVVGNSIGGRPQNGLPMLFLGIHHEGVTTTQSQGLNATEEGSEMVLGNYLKSTLLSNLDQWSTMV